MTVVEREPAALERPDGSSDQQVRQRLDAGGISTHRFGPARKGYEPVEVDAFLREVAEHVSRLEADVADARSRADSLSARLESSDDAAYQRIGADFGNVIRVADRAAAEVRRGAEANARATMAAARAEADRIVAEAHEAAERVVAGAREESARLRADAESVRAEAQGIRSEAESIRSQAQAAREDAEGLRGEAETMRAQASTMRAQAAAWRSQVLEEHRRLTQSRPAPGPEVSFEVPDVDFDGLSELLSGLTDES
jgi:DivIVA domain-containing protein